MTLLLAVVNHTAMQLLRFFENKIAKSRPKLDIHWFRFVKK
jgi:hypothetical protein